MRGAAVLGEQHLVALAPQHDRQQLAHRPLVVDDEDARGGRRSAIGVAAVWRRSSVLTLSTGRALRRAPAARTDDGRARRPAAS